MTLEQAIATLEIAHGQQMSDTVEEAIRTVLDTIENTTILQGQVTSTREEERYFNGKPEDYGKLIKNRLVDELARYIREHLDILPIAITQREGFVPSSTEYRMTMYIRGIGKEKENTNA